MTLHYIVIYLFGVSYVIHGSLFFPLSLLYKCYRCHYFPVNGIIFKCLNKLQAGRSRLVVQTFFPGESVTL